MAGGIVGAAAGLGDDADTLGLDAEGDDLALELVADLLEGTDVGHVASPCCFRARDRRGLDGDRQAEDDRRRTRLRAAAQRRMTAERPPPSRGRAFLPREEWAEGPGEESRPDVVAAQAIEANRSSARSSQREARRSRAPNSILRRRRGHRLLRTRARRVRA